MLALFSLRLALGMIACLPLLPARLTHPRFYRTHFLTALGLGCVAAAFLPSGAGMPLYVCLGAAIGLSFLASVVWRLDGAPGGHTLIWLTAAALAVSVWVLESETG